MGRVAGAPEVVALLPQVCMWKDKDEKEVSSPLSTNKGGGEKCHRLVGGINGYVVFCFVWD